MKELIRNLAAEASFSLRDRVTGKIRLRKDKPEAAITNAVRGERRFYRQLLVHALAANRAKKFWDEPLRTVPTMKQVWDVGCRNWSYVEALVATFPQAILRGVEVDGARRYTNLFRRIDFAEAYAEEFRSAGRRIELIGGDFRNVELVSKLSPREPVCFTFFFPFVSNDPCLNWGLPLRYADYESLLTHALASARAARVPATVVSCHQGEWEAEIVRSVYRSRGLEADEAIIPALEFAGIWPGRHDVHVFTLTARP